MDCDVLSHGWCNAATMLDSLDATFWKRTVAPFDFQLTRWLSASPAVAPSRFSQGLSLHGMCWYCDMDLRFRWKRQELL
eukprot:symbB.v1.2.028687.t1/scaffold3057.1/size64513/5